jgi:1-phosphatidylinositol-3-phosphate 5-kinase
MEFEKERARERKLLDEGRFRAFPVAKSKPIVEVFKNVEELVEEVSDEEDAGKGAKPSKQPSDLMEPVAAKTQAPENALVLDSGEEGPSKPHSTESSQELPPPELNAEHPHVAEKQPLMQTLLNFWADRSATGWNPLEYPLAASEHIFADSDVIVREDEPSSLIAFCLSSPDYLERLSSRVVPPDEKEKPHVNFQGKDEHELERWMLNKTGVHLKYQFEEGSARLSCKIFFSEQFDAFRKQCGCDEFYIQSLSRCFKWDSSGGKSGSAFLKTLDDRLVVKQLSQTELDAFVKFAPSYFEYMAEAYFHELPTVLAKIFGFYQIQIRNPITGKAMKMDVLVMENLFYKRKMSRIFDLKGSMRNRHVQQTGRENEVLLDENMVEYIYESPLFVREHAKKLLRTSLFNDTLFLAKMNVMDYSLVVGIDEDNKQLVVGIIGMIYSALLDMIR